MGILAAVEFSLRWNMRYNGTQWDLGCGGARDGTGSRLRWDPGCGGIQAAVGSRLRWDHTWLSLTCISRHVQCHSAGSFCTLALLNVLTATRRPLLSSSARTIVENAPAAIGDCVVSPCSFSGSPTRQSPSPAPPLPPRLGPPAFLRVAGADAARGAEVEGVDLADARATPSLRLTAPRFVAGAD